VFFSWSESFEEGDVFNSNQLVKFINSYSICQFSAGFRLGSDKPIPRGVRLFLLGADV